MTMKSLKEEIMLSRSFHIGVTVQLELHAWLVCGWFCLRRVRFTWCEGTIRATH